MSQVKSVSDISDSACLLDQLSGLNWVRELFVRVCCKLNSSVVRHNWFISKLKRYSEMSKSSLVGFNLNRSFPNFPTKVLILFLVCQKEYSQPKCIF